MVITASATNTSAASCCALMTASANTTGTARAWCWLKSWGQQLLYL